jgi:hypothetical protein
VSPPECEARSAWPPCACCSPGSRRRSCCLRWPGCRASWFCWREWPHARPGGTRNCAGACARNRGRTLQSDSAVHRGTDGRGALSHPGMARPVTCPLRPACCSRTPISPHRREWA